jgi:hypothetical protein
MRLIIASTVVVLFPFQLAMATNFPYPLGHATVGTPENGPLQAVGDFNGDGRVDLVALNFQGKSITLLLGQEDGSFSAAVPTSVGPTSGSPSALTAADLDGDGKLDLAVIINQPCQQGNCSAVLILGGVGDGTFSFGPTTMVTATGIAGTSFLITVADFDSDGNPDLAVGTTTSTILSDAPGLVTVLLGKGDGNFTRVGDLDAGNGITGLVADRIDGDQAADLVVTQIGSGGSSVSWFPGDGTGAFDAPVSISSDDGTTGVAATDLDGDTITDLVLARNFNLGDGFEGTVSVLLGKGDGTFNQADYAVRGANGGQVAIDDLDGDGQLDIVVNSIRAFSGEVSILHGMGGGGFEHTADLVIGEAQKLATGDFDHDGRADIAVGSIGHGVAAILLSNDRGPITPNVLPLSSIVLEEGEVTGDGKLDLVTAVNFCHGCPCAPEDGHIFTYPGKGDGTFSNPPTFSDLIDSPGWGALASIALGDFNNDHHPDLVAQSACTDELVLGFGNGAGGFAAPTRIANSIAQGTLFVRDLEGDGRLDLVVSDTANDKIVVLRGHGDGTFDRQLEYGTADGPTSITAADFNGDNILDLAVAASLTPGSSTESFGTVSIFLGAGDGTFQKGPDARVAGRPQAIVAAKLDANDTVDLAIYVTVGFENVKVISILGKGDGTFTSLPTNNIYFVGKEATVMTSGDFDGDGKLDVVIGTLSSPSIRMLQGIGDGNFAITNGYGPVFGGTAALLPGDVNGDGAPDLVAVGYFGSAYVFVSGCPGYPCPAPPPPADGGDLGAGSDGGAHDAAAGCSIHGSSRLSGWNILITALFIFLAYRRISLNAEARRRSRHPVREARES